MRAAVEYYWSSRSVHIDDTPLLMLYGENEPWVENHAEYLDQKFISCQTREIPDASHNSQVDNPEFIRAQIREFLSAQSRTFELDQVPS